MTLSDNTAGNLLFDALGGPAGVTGCLRVIGDAMMRLDRAESALNGEREGGAEDQPLEVGNPMASGIAVSGVT